MAEFRRNRGKKPKKTSAGATRVLASEVAKTRMHIHGLLALGKDMPDALKGPLTDKEAKRLMPTAPQIALQELCLPNTHAYLLVLRTMGQRMLNAMAPRVVYKFARKIEDHLEPGDTRLIVEYLNGLGFFEPSAPMTDDERADKMKKHASMEKVSLEDLKSRVLAKRIA